MKRRRHGRARKADPAVEKARLRELLDEHGRVLDGARRPLTVFEHHELSKLAWKYKYDPAFQDDTIVRGISRKPGPAPKHEGMPVMTNKVRISTGGWRAG